MNKKIQSFTLPLIASNLFQVIISLISLSIISRRSTDSLAAIAMIDSFLYAFGGILGVICLAFNIYGAKALGAEDEKKLKDYISSIFYLSIIIGTIFMLFLLFFGRGILQIIYGFTGDLLETATTYLFIMSPYILFTLLTFVFTNLLKIEKKTNRIFYVSIFTAVLQVVLSYIFINGELGLSPMGVLGSGLASMISLVIMVLIYFFNLKGILLSSIKNKPQKMKFLLFKSIPMVLQECCEGILFIIAFEGVVARLGVNILATYAIIGQGLMIARLPTLMYGNAVTVFASEANGSKSHKGVFQVGRITLFSSLSMYLGITFLIWIWKDYFFQFFTTDPSVFQLMPSMLPIMFIVMVVSPLYEISKYLLQSLERSTTVFALTASINIIVLSIILILGNFDKLNFLRLYSLYGINFLVLGTLFSITFIFHMKNRFQYDSLESF